MTRTLLCAALLWCSTAGAQGAWKLLYDPTGAAGYPTPSKVETALIWRASKIAGFLQEDGPGPAITLLARLSGPFLKAGAAETALVYGNGRQEIALLILRAGRPALHLLLSNDRQVDYLEAYSVKDIDGDSLRELAVVRDSQDGRLLTLLHFAGVERGALPQVDPDILITHSYCGPDQKLVPGEPAKARHRVWVLPGRPPKLKVDLWGTATCDSNDFKLLKTGLEPFASVMLPLPAKLALP